MSISNWPFINIQNKLQIVMSAVGSDEKEDKNNCATTDTSENAEQNLKWISVNYNGATLYGTFIEFAEVDRTARNIQFAYSGNNQINIIIPHFWESAIFDPNFQVLLGYNSKGGCDNITKHKSITGKLAGGVIGGVVGAACIVGAGIYYHSVQRKRKSLYRMSSGTSMIGKDVELDPN